MDFENPVVVVAVIAAAASILAALVAGAASGAATRGARAIASVNHRVARIDSEADQLREDFRQFIAAVGGTQSLAAIGSLLAASEVLCANPRAGTDLVKAVDSVRLSVSRAVAAAASRPGPTSARGVPLPDDAFEAMRSAFAASMERIAQERSGVLSERVPWWNGRRST